jgi:hypothetical protein
MSLTVAFAAAGAEVVVRVVAPLVPGGRDVSWALLGLVAPLLLWGTLLIVADQQEGVAWNVHMVSGILTLTALTGAATILVARNLRTRTAVL